ncbi:glycosyltransferase family 61 protein [Natrononativus amylolyticus]|uniref:glycosyltransferase family 61 protein n=1 Tax=Natrononativus amylolyticus TaxID=2963434 RepID=UPI0020CFAC69|nr:glycosyltransferase family 61 protein [Natrononativus amylolyticus]
MSLRRARRKARAVGPVDFLRRGVQTAAKPRLIAATAATRLRIPYRTRAELSGIASGCRSIGSAETITVEPPADAPAQLERVAGEYRLERPVVCTVANARLLGPDALAVGPDGAFLLETSLGRRDRLERSLLADPRLFALATARPGSLSGPRATDRRLGTVCSLVDASLEGYSHWVLKGLPRLEGLRRWEAEYGVRPSVLLPEAAPAYVRDSLACFRYGDDRLLEWDGTDTAVDRLVVPSVRSPEQRRSAYEQLFEYDLTYKLTSPAACAWLRSELRKGLEGDEPSDLPDPPANGGRRLYISRADAGRRRVLNEDAVLEALSPLGFESHALSNLAFADQARLFLETDVIVAPHGAGLANLAFASDCALVELFGEKVKPTYCMLASALGLEYEYMRCEPRGADLAVDPERIRAHAARYC